MSDQGGRAASRIPDFSSIEEEAEFWDTHDCTDFLDESKPFDVRVSPNFTSIHRFTSRLTAPSGRCLTAARGTGA